MDVYIRKTQVDKSISRRKMQYYAKGGSAMNKHPDIGKQKMSSDKK